MNDIMLYPMDINKDIHNIYKYMISDEQYMFSSNIVINSKKEFSEWLSSRLNDEFHDFYTIYLKGDCIGFVYDYEFSLKNGHCKIVSFIDERYRNVGYGGIASVMFIKKLFQRYPLRKVYSTVYEYNEQSFLNNCKAGFVEEGFLRKFRYYNGNYYGLHIFSIERGQFFETIGRLVK